MTSDATPTYVVNLLVSAHRFLQQQSGPLAPQNLFATLSIKGWTKLDEAPPVGAPRCAPDWVPGTPAGGRAARNALILDRICRIIEINRIGITWAVPAFELEAGYSAIEQRR